MNYCNDNKPYPFKAEFIERAARIWPYKKDFRWDKPWRTLDNFMWFLRFECNFLDSAVEHRRKQIKVIEDGQNEL